MDTTALIIAIIALTLGIGLNYWINRRKFYRRNMAGLEGFSSFEKSVFVGLTERIGKLIGYMLILVGFIFLFLAYIIEKDKPRLEKLREETKTELPARR